MSFAMLIRNASAWTALVSAGYPSVRWVDPETLERWMKDPGDNGLVLLDVRDPEEQALSHLPGAQHVNASRPDLLALDIPRDATVVVYCSVGLRSAAIVDDLEATGVQNVYNLKGGIFDWANRDRPIVRGHEPASEVHSYNGFWGMLLRKDRRSTD